MIDPFRALESAGIRVGMRVADFGCGTLGHYVFPAAQLVGQDGKVYAVDILKSVLGGIEGRAKMERATNVEAVWGDIERDRGVRLGDSSLDMVILANNLFMSRHRSGMMGEIARVLKPNGRLAIIEWKPTGLTIGPDRKDLVPSDEARRLAESAGLVQVGEFDPGRFHYGLIFAKR